MYPLYSVGQRFYINTIKTIFLIRFWFRLKSKLKYKVVFIVLIYTTMTAIYPIYVYVYTLNHSIYCILCIFSIQICYSILAIYVYQIIHDVLYPFMYLVSHIYCILYLFNHTVYNTLHIESFIFSIPNELYHIYY